MIVFFIVLLLSGAAGLAWLALNINKTDFAGMLRSARARQSDTSARLEELEARITKMESEMTAAKSVRRKKRMTPSRRFAAAGVRPVQAQNKIISPSSPVLARLLKPEVPGRPVAGSFSDRIEAVWKESEKNENPVDIARVLRMGVSEVELALKVKKMRPSVN